MFFINTPVGLADVALIWWLLANCRSREGRSRLDVVGIALLAVAFSSLIVFLGKGQENGWLHSDLILLLAIVFGLASAAAELWLALARRSLFLRRVLGHWSTRSSTW